MPVFIYDAVMPYRGETLLSHMLRQDLARLAAEEDEATSDTSAHESWFRR